jgi:3-oxoacyl-[acyl-carrier protein] reductase
LQVALITGSTGGLGERLALRLDRNGFRIIVHYHTSDKKAQNLRKQLSNKPFLCKADVRDFEEVGKMASAVESKLGRLDVLINNAAITKDIPSMRYPEFEWDNVIATNLKGVFNCLRHFIPLMVRSGGGHIINISSYSGLKGNKGQIAYSASKSALFGLTYSIAKEVSQSNIKVNTVIPGYLPVGMGSKAQKAKGIAKTSSIMGKLSNTDNISDFIAYLIRTDSITGQTFSFESRI